MSRPAGLGIRARARADAASTPPAVADELCAGVLELTRALVGSRWGRPPEHLALPPPALEPEVRR